MAAGKSTKLAQSLVVPGIPAIAMADGTCSNFSPCLAGRGAGQPSSSFRTHRVHTGTDLFNSHLVSYKKGKLRPPTRLAAAGARLGWPVNALTQSPGRTEAEFLNNWDAKPRKIWKSFGKRPILAGGNSNGDLHMLQYVAQQAGPSLSLLIHHTDARREYQYDKHTDKVMPLTRQEGWTVVDMKSDWKVVFPPAN